MMSLYCQDQLVAVERCSVPPLAAINVLSAVASNHTKVRDHEMCFRCRVRALRFKSLSEEGCTVIFVWLIHYLTSQRPSLFVECQQWKFLPDHCSWLINVVCSK